MTTFMTQTTRLVLQALRTAAEGQIEDGWQDVYLDNAFALPPVDQLQNRARGGHLSSLEKAGLYKVVDGFAWGRVKVEG